MTDEIKISLTKYEAVLLLEFVSRLNKSRSVEDKSEQRALWNLESLLEKELPFIFDDNKYNEFLNDAKKALQE